MIIGKGLLARAFHQAGLPFDDAIVVAAGVSNSVSDEASEFAREEQFLQGQLIEAKQLGLNLLYFGTTSIYDPEKSRSTYVQHKLRMERLLSEWDTTYVMRLPNVVGKSDNPNTLVNFLATNITQGFSYTAYIHQQRFLVDAEWVPLIARKMLDRKLHTENVCLNHGIQVGALIELMEEMLKKKSMHQPDFKLNHFEIPVSKNALAVFKELQLPFGQSFERDLLLKYLQG